MISVCFQDKPLTITVIQVYAPTGNAEEAEIEQFYEDLQRYWLGRGLDYCDIEWFALETNRNHSVVFEIASK